MSDTLSQTIGFPRIGRRRDLKRALEAYWAGTSSEAGLIRARRQVEEDSWRAQQEAGIARIGIGDSSLYDPFLDWAIRFGAIPERHRSRSGLELYFALARGAAGAPALELTKWFDTNYHYLVPELDSSWKPEPDFADYLEGVRRAAQHLGQPAVPIVLGPLTFLRLSRLELPLAEALQRLLPLYTELLGRLREIAFGASLDLRIEEVQIHEPALVLPQAIEDRPLYQEAYARLERAGLPIQLVTYFDDLGEAFPWASRLPVSGLALDFTRGDNLALLRRHGWPGDRELSAGVVDGRGVWRSRPEHVLPLLDEIRTALDRAGSAPRLRVAPSCSLQFVPYSVQAETALPQELKGVLAFADEKLGEVRRLAAYGPAQSGGAWSEEAGEAWRVFERSAPARPAVRDRVRRLTPQDLQRRLNYAERRPRQISLPLFPTTTIGSFPQTREIRALRRRLKDGRLDAQAYQDGIDSAIRQAIEIQEEIGLDVLVHGEFERSDMVEYFAERLEGFAITENGWVQSYGSRCVRPPIIFADIHRPAALTVREFAVAQSATSRPVKGMLTGPVTILNWSYPRADLPRREIALQIALALRQEIADLEAAGARAIQVDEPALREGLPLRQDRRSEYVRWAVDAFRLATGGARPETQIHTHMCYGDFGDVLEAIDQLDADVISLENARSGDETLAELAGYGYRREVGPGVYDVHSPAVLSLDAAVAKLRTFVRHLGPDQLWVNPDCGLKTRDWPEVLASLRNLVAAAKKVREEVGVRQA